MSSKIERLDSEVKIPYDEAALLSGNPRKIAEYTLRLVKTLQELLEKITILTNYSVDLNDGEAVYFALKDSTGEYPDGTWRRMIVGDNLEEQKKIDGEWTFVQRREPPV